MGGEDVAAGALAAVSMDDVQQKIADRIKASFVELMPEGAWIALVKTVCADFTTDRPSSYGNAVVPSQARQMIEDELRKRFAKVIAKELSGDEWCGDFGQSASGDNVTTPGEAVKAIIKACLPEIVQAAFGGVVQAAVDAVGDRMRSGGF